MKSQGPLKSIMRKAARLSHGPASVFRNDNLVIGQKRPLRQPHLLSGRDGKQNTDVSEGQQLESDSTVVPETPSLVVHQKDEVYESRSEKPIKRSHVTKIIQPKSTGEGGDLPLAQWLLDGLLQELVYEVTDAIFRWATKDFVDAYLAEAALRHCASDILSEAVQLLLPGLVEEAQGEMAMDDVLEADLLPEVLAEEARAVVLSELAECDSQVTINQLTQVMHYTNNRVMDMFLMGHLVELVASQGRCFAEMDQSRRLLDSWMLDVLSLQLFNELRLRNITMENVPLRNFHRRIFTDIALDVVLTELTESLDEDMEHRLEYEQQMEDTSG